MVDDMMVLWCVGGIVDWCGGGSRRENPEGWSKANLDLELQPPSLRSSEPISALDAGPEETAPANAARHFGAFVNSRLLWPRALDRIASLRSLSVAARFVRAEPNRGDSYILGRAGDALRRASTCRDELHAYILILRTDLRAKLERTLQRAGYRV